MSIIKLFNTGAPSHQLTEYVLEQLDLDQNFIYNAILGYETLEQFLSDIVEICDGIKESILKYRLKKFKFVSTHNRLSRYMLSNDELVPDA